MPSAPGMTTPGAGPAGHGGPTGYPIPGQPGSGPAGAAAAQVPQLEEGTAEYAIQQVGLKLAAGEQDGLDEFISEKARGKLAKFRAGEADETDVAEAQQEMVGVTFVSMRDAAGGKTAVFRNQAGQVVTFTAKREGGDYKVTGLKVETPRGRR